MTNREKRQIVSVGNIYLDVNAPVGHPLITEEEQEASSYELVPGGSAFRFAATCVQLGLPSIFIGKVGKDLTAKMLQVLISETGVKPHLIGDSAVQTGIGINLGFKDRTYMVVAGNANQSMHLTEIKNTILDVLKNLRAIFYLGGVYKQKFLLPMYPDLLNILRRKGFDTKVVLDHGRFTDRCGPTERRLTRQLIALVDYYFPSSEELLQTFRVDDIRDAVEKYREITVGDRETVMVVKMGDEGCLVVKNDAEPVKVSAYEVPVVSTVGAGDAFNAGFLAATENGSNSKVAAMFACATAALQISQQRPPELEMVKQFMAAH